jgi:hypothetical protein
MMPSLLECEQAWKYDYCQLKFPNWECLGCFTRHQLDTCWTELRFSINKSTNVLLAELTGTFDYCQYNYFDSQKQRIRNPSCN